MSYYWGTEKKLVKIIFLRIALRFAFLIPCAFLVRVALNSLGYDHLSSNWVIGISIALMLTIGDYITNVCFSKALYIKQTVEKA